jgi:hypothetical protein
MRGFVLRPHSINPEWADGDDVMQDVDCQGMPTNGFRQRKKSGAACRLPAFHQASGGCRSGPVATVPERRPNIPTKREHGPFFKPGRLERGWAEVSDGHLEPPHSACRCDKDGRYFDKASGIAWRH